MCHLQADVVQDGRQFKPEVFEIQGRTRMLYHCEGKFSIY
jgi:hypothetical protein